MLAIDQTLRNYAESSAALSNARARASTFSWSSAFRRLCTCVAVLLGAFPATLASGTPYVKSKSPDARTARSISIDDKSKLHRVQVIGNTLIEEGNAEGTLKGRVKIRLNLEAERSSATSHFAMYLSGGDLLGHANGKATAGKEGWESFGGEMWIDDGTGRYAHASGSGKMYGAINRHTDVLIVQVTGHAQGL
jgi:hypothetical protein